MRSSIRLAVLFLEKVLQLHSYQSPFVFFEAILFCINYIQSIYS